jgi:hypothetical protein
MCLLAFSDVGRDSKDALLDENEIIDRVSGVPISQRNDDKISNLLFSV